MKLPRKRIEVSEETLRKLYVEQRMTSEQVGKELGISSSRVLYLLKSCDIPVRTRSEAARKEKFIGRKVNWNPSELQRLYWEEKLSTNKIAQILGVSQQSISNAMKRLGIPRRSFEETNREIAQKYRKTGSEHPSWKGGRVKDSRGYILIRNREHPRAGRDSYVPEHILVWEQVHNKPLLKGYIVHHLNGVTTDNRPENLVALPSQKHAHVLAAKGKRIRELEAKVKLLEKALEQNQLIFNIGEN